MNSADSAEGVKEAASAVNDVGKQMSKGRVRELDKLIRNLKTAVAEHKRATKQAATDPAAGPVAAAPPLWTVLTTVSSHVGDTCTNSVHEAKSAMNAAKTVPVVDLLSLLRPLQATKRAKKDLTAHLRHSAQGVVELRDAPTRRKLEKILRKAFDGALFTTLLLPDLPYAEKVYTPSWFGMAAKFLHVGFAPFAVMEAKFVESGTLVVAGLAYEQVPGASLKEKRRHLFMAQYEEVKALLAQGGWVAKVETNECLVVPSGYLTVTCALEPTLGLRWGVSGDTADCDRVQFALTQLLNSFPEMRNASLGHQPFLDFLSSDSEIARFPNEGGHAQRTVAQVSVCRWCV